MFTDRLHKPAAGVSVHFTDSESDTVRRKKRRRNGTDKPQSGHRPQRDREEDSEKSENLETGTDMPSTEEPKSSISGSSTKTSKNKPTPHPKIQKLSRLPRNVKISKRPILRPPIPNPHSSSAQTVYVTKNTPFVPTVKRIRNLLSHIDARINQSLRASGRLSHKDVERHIAAKSRPRAKPSSPVYVKATGQAIERALQFGVYFQGQGDCGVKVEIGSVSAVDDIEVVENEEEEEERSEGVKDTTNQKGGTTDGSLPGTRKRGHNINVEDVPETRVRTLSTVTVAITLK